MTAPVHLTRPSEEEAEIFLIDLELMASIFRKNLPLIVCTTVLMMAISCAYALFVYRENFTSSATILLNLDALPDENTEKANLTNPFITQETFLNSPYMMEAVSLAVREPDSKKPLAFNSSITPTQLSKDLKAFHIKETSFIKLQADANSPKRAKTLLEAYLSTYIHELDTITSSPMNQTFAALNKQLADGKKKLAETNQALNEFQKQYGLIDVDAETQLLVKTVDRLERTKEEVEEQIAAKHAEIERLSSQLNLDTETAIASAAKGQNLAYIKLVQDLNDAEQDYAIKSLTYAPTNPNLKKLKQKVDVLREQIDKMSLQMVGERHANNNIVISDDVRRDLVTELAVTEAD
ncbi:MAG: hypothetical protein KC476_03660, partial [Cyanobacteria bacterium HKST-UBA06]|nr:hypothetical protein [Cyanobacteria bacterium HKST-UBA06]